MAEMRNPISPQDADLIALRTVARLGRLVIAVGLTLAGLWILPLMLLYSVRSATPASTTPTVIGGVLSLVAFGLFVFVVVRMWSGILRGGHR